MKSEVMTSAVSSEANISHNRKLAQQLRTGKPESVVEAYREVRVPPRGWYLFVLSSIHQLLNIPSCARLTMSTYKLRKSEDKLN